MKSLIQSRVFREGLLFAGLLGAALVLSSLFGDVTFATSLINSSDNPSAISAATGGENDLVSLLKTILNFFLGFLGFVATIMIIYGGILLVTSAGNEESATKAKQIITYAVAGIILILLSFAIVNTVLGAGLGGAAGTTS